MGLRSGEFPHQRRRLTSERLYTYHFLVMMSMGGGLILLDNGTRPTPHTREFRKITLEVERVL